MTTEQTREARLRRAAQRIGLSIQKSRKDGTYGLVDTSNNTLAAYTDDAGYGMSLDQIEAGLNEPSA
jgi:hypothetical protein